MNDMTTTNGQMNLQQMANSIAASGMFGIKSPAQALTLMLLAQAEGRHPMTVTQDYHIIQNRPALKADAILARFQKSGGRVEWLQLTEKIAEGKFTHPEGGSAIILWSIEMAQKAGLTKNPTWQAYPRPMLRSRTIAEGVRTVYPAVLCGMYAVEEMMDVNMRDETSLATILPESTPTTLSDEEKELRTRHRYLRGKLNQALIKTRDASATEDEANFRSACKEFQQQHGKGIWDAFTYHNESETFRALADEHLKRITDSKEREAETQKQVAENAEARTEFLARLKACTDPIAFDALADEYEATPALKVDADILEAIQTKGRDDFGYTYTLADELEGE